MSDHLSLHDRARARAVERWGLGRETEAPYGAGAYRKGVVLIVGEAHTSKFAPASDMIDSTRQAPFCSMGGCSGWLNERLEEANIPESEMFWVNTIHDGVYTDLAQLVFSLKPREIIALGRIAHRALHTIGIFHHEVPHPQYWARFKHKHAYPLIEILRRFTLDVQDDKAPA